MTTVALMSAAGCSTAPKAGETNATRAEVAEVAQPKAEVIESAISSNCRLSTVGLPCDPDGNGAATECEGVCWIDDAALVSCLPVADVNMITTDLNGRICGDVEGRNCGRSCENGECVDKNARLGTACRPNNNSSTCDGVCTLIGGNPACDEVTVCGSVAISDDGCTLRACNFETFEDGCKMFELDNAVCDASQLPPVIEAGASSGPQDAAAPRSDAGDAGDAAAVTPGTPDAAAQDAAATGETQTSSDAARDAATPTDATSAPSSLGAVDGGGDASVPVGVYGNRPTKVIGGACTTTPTGSSTSGFGAVLAAVLGLVAARRRTRRV